jgi:deoxycytidylate deaminase
MNNIPNIIVKLAEELSAKSDMRQKVSAVIFNDTEVLGQGYNKWLGTCSVPRNVLYGVPVRSIHAEIAAIRWTYRKYGESAFVGASIYIHRKGNKLARPCSHCAQVIEMFALNPVWSPLEEMNL